MAKKASKTSKTKKSSKADDRGARTGYRALRNFQRFAHLKPNVAQQGPAAVALAASRSKKLRPLRKKWQQFAEVHRKHPVLKLANHKKLDALDLSLLYVLLQRAFRELTDRWPVADPTPVSLLRWAGLDSEDKALEQLGRFRPKAALVRLGLIQCVSAKDKALLLSHFAVTPKALSVAFGDPDLAAAIEAGLPTPPKAASNNAAPLLVWPPDLTVQMERVVHAAKTRAEVLAKTGLLDRLPAARGVHVLVQGPPGTGKTLAAREIASRLKRPLRLLHGPDIQSCWIGEAEKEVRAMYRKATKDNVVLCLDEIDALISNRDDARHAWERSIVDAFLVEMEQFQGIAVYTTNRAESLDPAFERRLAFRLDVPRPEREQRLAIWRAHLPDTVPLAGDVCWDKLAEPDLTGAEIQNAVLAAITEASLREPLSVTAADFVAGVANAQAGRWTQPNEGEMGFRMANKEQ